MPAFVSDADLEYERLATRFAPGAGLAMDESYRRAHLPLMAPDHPGVIREDAARGYLMGRHETIWSLVVPLEWEALARSQAFSAMHADMRVGPLASKVDWVSFEQRRDALHATIAGNLARGAAPVIPEAWRAAFRAAQPFRIALRGLFSGNINLGRLYLKLYPEDRDGNALQALQHRLGVKETGLYVVGLYNLIDDLDAKETAWLAGFITRYRDQNWLEATVGRLHLLGARDDLALDSEVAEAFRLV